MLCCPVESVPGLMMLQLGSFLLDYLRLAAFHRYLHSQSLQLFVIERLRSGALRFHICQETLNRLVTLA